MKVFLGIIVGFVFGVFFMFYLVECFFFELVFLFGVIVSIIVFMGIFFFLLFMLVIEKMFFRS